MINIMFGLISECFENSQAEIQTFTSNTLFQYGIELIFSDTVMKLLYANSGLVYVCMFEIKQFKKEYFMSCEGKCNLRNGNLFLSKGKSCVSDLSLLRQYNSFKAVERYLFKFFEMLALGNLLI